MTKYKQVVYKSNPFTSGRLSHEPSADGGNDGARYLNSFGAKSWSDFRQTCHSWSPGNVLKVMASPDCCMSETAFRVDDNRGSSVPTEM